MTHYPSRRSLQLDLFRGGAGLLMVLNHAGFAWLAPADSTAGIAGIVVFLGSAAPALFYFATGVGMGMARKSGSDWPGLWRKVLLLFIADMFLNWAEHRWLGLDFFGFCAISMLAVALIDATLRSRLAASAALVLVLFVRYADAPALERLVPGAPWLAFLTGVSGVQNVSYPLCPWLAFPLAGYLLGRASPWLDSTRAAAAIAAGAAVMLGFSFGLAQRGAVVHRWGSVSFAYFVFAAGFVALVWLLARAAGDAGDASWHHFLRLRGPASLLVVPIHYALIEMGAAMASPPWGVTVWFVAVCLLAPVTLVASRTLAERLKAVAGRPNAGPALVVALGIAVMCSAVAAAYAVPLVCWLVVCLSQIVVAAALARPPRVVIEPRRVGTL